jgi:hypothetical protein
MKYENNIILYRKGAAAVVMGADVDEEMNCFGIDWMNHLLH